MRLPHRSDIVGLIVGAASSVSGHPRCGITQERDDGAANGQSHENHRLDRSLVDNRNHSVCQSCPGVQTCSFAVIIHPKKEGFQRARLCSDMKETPRRPRAIRACQCPICLQFYNEDHEQDRCEGGISKSVSMHRLVKKLKTAGIESFTALSLRRMLNGIRVAPSLGGCYRQGLG